MNPHIAARLTGIQQQLMAQHAGGAGLPNAMIGGERELLVQEFLAKVFPNSYRFGTGAITDSQNHLSGQVDVVVELPFEPSFPMPAGNHRLYLAESVGVVIEVKSNLYNQWDELIATTTQVKALERNIQAIMHNGNMPIKIPVYGVSYTGYQTINGIQNRLDAVDAAVRPDGILVIDSGCYVGPEINATGAWGLYGLIASIQRDLESIKAANSNLLAYALP